MERMEEYPSEFTKPLLLSFDLLSRCNIGFFDENVSFIRKYWRFIYIIPFVLIQIASFTAFMSKMFTEHAQIYELVFMVPVYLTHIQGLLEAIVLMPNKRHIEHLVTKLGTSWRSDHLTEEQIRKKNNLLKKLNLSQTVFCWGSILSTWLCVIVPFMITLFRRFVLYQDSDLQLPFGCIFPFNPAQNWIIYIIVYVFQSYTLFWVVYFYIGSEFIMITLCAYLAIEFSLLREDLLNIAPATNDILNDVSRLEQRQGLITIQQFIRKHQELIHCFDVVSENTSSIILYVLFIRLTKQLDGIFSWMIFINLLFVSVITSFLGFAATVAHRTVDKANNYLSVLALLFTIYIISFYSELLNEESAGIADSAYEHLWYRGGTHYQKMIGLIIMRSQKPCCLTSLEYIPITLNTFTKVVSTTWSYFSLATSIYSQN